MKQSLSMLVLVLLPFWAHSEEASIDVPTSAQPVVGTVDRFFAALSAGKLDEAAAELDPNLIVLETGGAEHSAVEYLAHHAKEDAKFLQTVRYSLLRRTARVGGSLAWVASEGEFHGEKDGRPVAIATAETIVLRARGRDWKIVHIHWSSRPESQ